MTTERTHETSDSVDYYKACYRQELAESSRLRDELEAQEARTLHWMNSCQNATTELADAAKEISALREEVKATDELLAYTTTELASARRAVASLEAKVDRLLCVSAEAKVHDVDTSRIQTTCRCGHDERDHRRNGACVGTVSGAGVSIICPCNDFTSVKGHIE